MTLPLLIALISAGASSHVSVSGRIEKKSAADENRQQQDSKPADEGLKIKVDVHLVTVDVTVAGVPSSELRAEDFIVYDNNIAQEASYFSQNQLPLAIALLIDKSGSTAPYLPILQIAGLSALRRLKPEDQVALFAFDNGYDKLSDLTEDRLQISEKLGKLKFEGQTNIFNAVYDAARYLKSHAPQRRRSIILISDNMHNLASTFGLRNAKQCRTELLETATTLYNLAVQPDLGEDAVRTRRQIEEIKQLAVETGGEALDVGDPASIKAILEKAIDRLRTQYTLGFYPSNPGQPGSFHKLDVRWASNDRCPGCRLLARTGYYDGVAAPVLPKERISKAVPRSSPKVDELLIQRSITIAGMTNVDMDEIPFTALTVRQIDVRGQPQLQIDGRMDSAGIDLSPVGGLNAYKIMGAVFFTDEIGKILGADRWSVEQPLNEEDYKRILVTGISFSRTIPLMAKTQTLRIVVYDVKSDRISSQFIRLHTPAQQKDTD